LAQRYLIGLEPAVWFP